jgi:hypothetical protein
MNRVVFEPTIPVFELAKTFHALDRSATEIGRTSNFRKKNRRSMEKELLSKNLE